MAHFRRGEDEPVQRLTLRPAEALRFATEAEAAAAATALTALGVLRGRLRPARLGVRGRPWGIRYGEDDAWVHDPDR